MPQGNTKCHCTLPPPSPPSLPQPAESLRGTSESSRSSKHVPAPSILPALPLNLSAFVKTADCEAGNRKPLVNVNKRTRGHSLK